ncbi:hypothetical protein [Alkalihalobacterium elongatum]|uniref:hypothetical protein n=1 Tax=Alkalihalobacterium elongatum TaxID=2675466 RepID=UPI001C1FDD5A|nr:hypothetical protein [Alkalihalobacterium elongatum]
MFRGNAAVIILPLILMGFIFYGGYHYLNTSDQITNEELDSVVSLVVETSSNGNKQTISGSWDWKEMPIDGVVGQDYIGVKLVEEENQQLVNSDYILSSKLTLRHSGKEIYETNGTFVFDGIIFEFPNEVQEHIGYGNLGTFEIVLDGEQFAGNEISVSYLHTWVEHDGLFFEQARLSEVSLDIDYWTIERFTTIPQQ